MSWAECQTGGVVRSPSPRLSPLAQISSFTSALPSLTSLFEHVLFPRSTLPDVGNWGDKGAEGYIAIKHTFV